MTTLLSVEWSVFSLSTEKNKKINVWKGQGQQSEYKYAYMTLTPCGLDAI